MDDDPPKQAEFKEQADPLGNIDTMDVGLLENKLKESLKDQRYV
jgi:hypothetical protein